MSTTPCSKIAYATCADAHAAIARIIKSHRAKRVSAYLCEFCDKWHLTHHKPKGRPRAGKEGETRVTRYKTR